MSPRAAWRLESLGFGEVYDYVGSKMEWIGAGLPWEGSDALEPTLGTLADADVALCALDDMVGAVRGPTWPEVDLSGGQQRAHRGRTRAGGR